jgi:hypothetical protein
MTPINYLGLIIWIPSIAYGLHAILNGKPALQKDFWIVSILIFLSTIMMTN